MAEVAGVAGVAEVAEVAGRGFDGLRRLCCLVYSYDHIEMVLVVAS